MEQYVSFLDPDSVAKYIVASVIYINVSKSAICEFLFWTIEESLGGTH